MVVTRTKRVGPFVLMMAKRTGRCASCFDMICAGQHLWWHRTQHYTLCGPCGRRRMMRHRPEQPRGGRQ